MYYIADTHAFLWYLTDSPQISLRAKNIFELCENGEVVIVVPIIVLLEILDILEKKKVKFDFDILFDKISESNNYIIQNLDTSLFTGIKQLQTKLELHDRTIVATAKKWDAKIISKDSVIHDEFPEITVW